MICCYFKVFIILYYSFHTNAALTPSKYPTIFYYMFTKLLLFDIFFLANGEGGGVYYLTIIGVNARKGFVL